ncbi:MAG TPA: DVUA0089 family protein, partial [Nitrosospira sp.]|nr:DVUA0089 family protein [Nitrosospira sp.]
TTGVGALTEIDGTLSPWAGDGQDMYRIHIDGGRTFSATTVGGVAGFDSELFLFDNNGKGVYGNDDVVSDNAPATLPAGNALTPIASGDYYLVITQCCSEPTSSGGQIFPVSDTFDNHNNDINGPTGPGGTLPVISYSGLYEDIPGGGSYRVFLTGAHAAIVPEPQAFALMLAGLGMVSFFAYRRTTA